MLRRFASQPKVLSTTQRRAIEFASTMRLLEYLQIKSITELD
jgi:hypothetical protein